MSKLYFQFLIKGLIGLLEFKMLTNGQLPTPSHLEGTSDPGLSGQFQEITRDVEELKKDKESAKIEQRVGDNLGGVHSPHHQRTYDKLPTHGYYDMPAQSSWPFHESGY
ncbi:hypothetical protein M9H77_31703 [Catharanthus roseus]|uniref:Uncharacterized protein n=1 Tax=Catharanthus roseus TaxID=4058 RepID=A0ACC0A1S3_CATRO|nr:hypothetical protein M9H77_31703 [Catharanthus roseus]